MVFDGRRLWFFHGEENFTATPCRLFYVAREGISPIMGVRIFTTLWVWQILHGVVGVVMWSIKLNWLSLAEMIERKSYYIYIIYIYYIYIIKFYFTISPSVLFYWPRDHTDHTDHAPNKKPVFSVVSSWWTGHWRVGVFSPVRVCVIRKLYPFWHQHPREDSGCWAFGAVAGFVPICRWRRTGKTSKCIQGVYKNYRNFGKVWFLCLCIQKCRTQKIAYSGILQ